LTAPTGGFFARGHFNAAGAPPTFEKIVVNVANATPNEEAAGGKLVATVRYSRPSDQSKMNYAVSAEIQNISLATTPIELVFDLSESPIPTDATDIALTVSYRGSLGLDNDGIAVGSKLLKSPFPVHYANVSDYTTPAEWY